MKQSDVGRLSMWLQSIVLVTCFASSAIAQSAAETVPESEPVNRQPTARANPGVELLPAPPPGLRVYVDPATGQLTSQPTREQRQALDRLIRAQRQSQVRAPLRQFALDRGGVGVKLDDRFYSLLEVESDGVGAWKLRCEAQGDDPTHQPSISGSEDVRTIETDANGNPVQ